MQQNKMSSLDRLVCIDDFEKAACKKMTNSAHPLTWEYYRGGADEEITLRESVDVFRRYRLRPRVLRDLSKRDISTTILGHRIAFPCCISPTAFHKALHDDGEAATAKAAADCGVLMAVSIASSIPLEQVASAAPSGLRWMNIYLFKDRRLTEALIRRAERSHFNGVLITIDMATFGKKRGISRSAYYQLATKDTSYSYLNFANLEMFDEDVREARAEGDEYLWNYSIRVDDSFTWADIAWIKQITSLPIILKGILTGEMALEAVKAGVDGIIVSAHGGRQLDSVVAPLEALPEVVEAVRDSPVEVYMDGGVRTGTDIVKALALGARAVFIGRPVIWGLACAGEKGVKAILEILKDEFSRAMSLCGCAQISDIDRTLIRERALSKL